MKPLGTSSKAHTLLELVGTLKTAVVLPVSVVTRSEWNTKPDETLHNATASLQSNLFAVRSSAPTEDLEDQTGAGRYLSCLDVTLSQVGDRIADVFDSYERSEESRFFSPGPQFPPYPRDQAPEAAIRVPQRWGALGN